MWRAASKASFTSSRPKPWPSVTASRSPRQTGKDIRRYPAKGDFYGFRYEGEPFKFVAPWKEHMIANPGDYIGTNAMGSKEYYRIEKNAFAATYAEAKKMNGRLLGGWRNMERRLTSTHAQTAHPGPDHGGSGARPRRLARRLVGRRRHGAAGRARARRRLRRRRTACAFWRPAASMAAASSFRARA